MLMVKEPSTKGIEKTIIYSGNPSSKYVEAQDLRPLREKRTSEDALLEKSGKQEMPREVQGQTYSQTAARRKGLTKQ